MKRDIWQAAERLLQSYGDMAEQECRDRISYCHMTWNPAGARAWRQRLDLVGRLRRGERPPLLLDEAVATGRFHDFLAEQEANGIRGVSYEDEATEVIRQLIRTRLLELHTAVPT